MDYALDRKCENTSRTVLITFYAVLLFFFTSGILHAREPAALVIEIAYMDDSIPPPPCDRFIFTGGEFHLDPNLSAAIQKGILPDWVHLEEGLESFEDVSKIVMVRRDDSCAVWLSIHVPPSPSEVSASLKIDRWRFHTDESVTVIMGNKRVELKQERFLCIDRDSRDVSKGKCRIVLYNYGILPIWVGGTQPKPAVVSTDDSVSGRYSGPGDTKVFTVPLSEPGMLIVEYRSSRGPGSIDIVIKDDKGRIMGRGGASFESPMDAEVELKYRGYGPADFDAGFLFSPDPAPPLNCSLQILKEDKVYRVVVTIENRGKHPIEAYKPGAGTVTWYADGAIIAGAHPGRPPMHHLYKPTEKVPYSLVLLVPEAARTIEAEFKGETCPIKCSAELPGE